MKIQITTPLSIHEKGGRLQFEDYLFPEPGKAGPDDRLFIVADAGPGELGRIGAELAAQNFAEYFEILPPADDVDEAYMEQALTWVEESISTYIQGNPDTKGLSTTLSLVHIGPKVITIAWIGDSRVYYYDSKKKKLEVTEDHSVINDLIQRGKIQPEDAATHKDRYRLLRAIQGSENPTQIDTRFIPISQLNPGDYFLVCSDGLLESLNNQDILTLFDNIATPSQIIAEIAALSQSNRDNYSCYLIPVREMESLSTGAAASATPLSQEAAPAGESTAQETTPPSSILEQSEGLFAKDLVVYSLVGTLALVLIFLVYWALQGNNSSYEELMSRGNESMKQNSFGLATAQYDSAYQHAGTATEKDRTLRLKEKAARSQYLVQIAELDTLGTYPAYMKAIDLTAYAIEHFGDEGDTLYKLSKRLDQQIAVISPEMAFPQLLAEATRLCTEGESEIAETYFSEADKFDEALKQERALSDAKKACIDAYAKAAAAEQEKNAEQPVSEVSDAGNETVSRSIEPRQPNGSATTGSSTPGVNTSVSSEGTEPVVAESSAAAGAPTAGQLAELQKGKSLYEKATGSQSSYEYRKAAEYLQNAGPALDEEGYYLLAQLYQKGLGVRQDLKKGLEYARQSALKGSGDGHFLYAHLLLLRLNPGDSLTAKKSLRIAVEKGSKEAELRLRLIQP